MLEYLSFTIGPSSSLPLFYQFFACSGSQLQTLDILHNGGLHGPIGSTVLIPSPALQIRSLSDNDKDPSRFLECLCDSSTVLPSLSVLELRVGEIFTGKGGMSCWLRLSIGGGETQGCLGFVLGTMKLVSLQV